jgi:hypothetical protein
MNIIKPAVYDRQNNFARFLKHEFKKTIDFDSFRNFDSFENEINNYSTILFVIYSEDEIEDFIKIYKKRIPIIVCTPNNSLFLKMISYNGILVLDTSRIKSEVIIDLKSYLN